MKTTVLLGDEITQLDRLKTEHRPFFDAMMYSMSVIVDRNHKYTGEEADRDIFANFELDAKIQGKTTMEIFRQWISKKTARAMLNDKDYEDEKFFDTLRDLGNFAYLWIGYIFQQMQQKEIEILDRKEVTGVGHTDYFPEDDREDLDINSDIVLVTAREVSASKVNELLNKSGVSLGAVANASKE